MTRTAILVVLTLLAAGGAGCIENMRDLKDRMSGADAELAEPLEQQSLNLTNDTDVVNATPAFKAPIARISVYADGGALLYKASFVAENDTSVLPVEEGSPLTLNAADSETREAGATIATYAWALGSQTAEGRQATITPDAPGPQTLTLTIVDSNGESDVQTIALGVAPAPFDVTTEFTTGAVAGTLGAGQAGTGTFDVVDVHKEMPVRHLSATVVATPSADCDVSLEVLDAEGERVGRVDAHGAPDPQTETLNLGNLTVGTYTVKVGAFACASPGVPVKVTLRYAHVVEGLEDGHGGHAH